MLKPSKDETTWSTAVGAVGKRWYFSRPAVHALSPFYASLPITLDGLIGYLEQEELAGEGRSQIEYFGLELEVTVIGERVYIDEDHDQ